MEIPLQYTKLHSNKLEVHHHTYGRWFIHETPKHRND